MEKGNLQDEVKNQLIENIKEFYETALNEEKKNSKQPL